MSEPQEPLPDALAEAIRAFQRMSVPEVPPAAAILARLDDEKAPPGAIPSSSKRSGLPMRLLIPSAAAAVLVMGGLGWLLLHGTASIALADVVRAAAKHK